MRIKVLTAALALGIAACGDTEPADTPPVDAPPPGQAAAPAATDWFQVDEAAQTVTIDLVAGSTADNSHWNFNGYYGGRGSITVPEGYTVTINLTNRDPNMGHSVGVGERMATYPANFTTVTPAFEGAVTSNPTSMTESTMPGESESITFTADRAGDYALVCYVVGHASAGMWIAFTVSATGEHGVGS